MKNGNNGKLKNEKRKMENVNYIRKMDGKMEKF